MLNPRLQKAYESFDRWCSINHVLFDLVCDEDDLQGYLVPRKYDTLTPRLSEYLKNMSLREGLYCREQRTRSGTVYAISLQAINEQVLDAMIPMIDKSRLARRLDLVFDCASNAPTVQEQQYVPPTKRHGFHFPTRNIGSKITKRLQESLGIRPSIKATVSEALDGIAADYQPMDVLKQFEAALRDLGLLDKLKAANITNRLSPDKQIIHFYAGNDDGPNGRTEIAAYELVKLATGKEMEKAIKDLVDLARKRAPGTSEREAQAIKDREAQVRDIAKQHAPEAQAKAAEQMAQKPGATNIGAGAAPVEGLASRLLAIVEGS